MALRLNSANNIEAAVLPPEQKKNEFSLYLPPPFLVSLHDFISLYQSLLKK